MDIESRTSQSESDATASSLLSPSSQASPASNGPAAAAPRPVLMRLYTSHTLSAWNSRMFEFGAVLFLASIFPGTLLYASIYALVRAFSAAAFSSWIGARVDRSDRLVALRHSIGRFWIAAKARISAEEGLVWQRVPVAASCLCFVALLSTESWGISMIIFTIVGFLACVEKLAATANVVAVERDWVCEYSVSLWPSSNIPIPGYCHLGQYQCPSTTYDHITWHFLDISLTGL